jgi:hypothetical protein
MGLPRFRIRSLLIGVALVAALLAATVEIVRAPFFAIMVYIFVPAIVIGLWQRLGFGGILVEVGPSCLAVFLAWAAPIPALGGLGLFTFLAGILGAVLLWCALAAAPKGSHLRALSTSALWGILSMLCSLALALFCNVGVGMIWQQVMRPLQAPPH